MAQAGDAGLARDWQVPFPLDVPLTLSMHRRGGGDPAYRVDPAGAVWRTSLTPEGPGTLRAASRPAAGGTRVTGQAWGPGARWLLDALPAQLGFDDDRSGFTARHPVLSELALRYAGLRVGRTGRVFEALVPAILEQKVVGQEARRAWRYLLLKFGSAAPGPAPAGMRVCPPPAAWVRIPSWDWHRAGVEGVRARTIIAAAEVAARLEELAGPAPAGDAGPGPGAAGPGAAGPGAGGPGAAGPGADGPGAAGPGADGPGAAGSGEADRRLRSLPGIGPWTSAEVRQRAMGDPDAVSVGDYHLPRAVGWALARRITDDDGMLELLAPYAGHRYRVTRLIELGGGGPPRRGPRMPVRDYRAF